MLLAAAAVFIGSQACRPCHTAISDAYSRTAMARSSGPVTSLEAVKITAAGHRYRIAGKQLYFDSGRGETAVSIDYFIGSMAAGRSLLTFRDRYLYELPVTWYSRKQLWDASPGYEHETEVKLNRAVEPSCLSCHASRVRPIVNTQNRYGDPPFLENGIGCERCHGPGSEHVRDPEHAAMINPAKLAAARRDSVCSQCHLTGDARIERAGRRVVDFRPGDLLSDYATYFVKPRAPGDLKVTSHVEKLQSSRCKRASGDKLWCGTCHDPHDESRTAAMTQAACTGCHRDAHHQHEACATCHMPKSKTVDGGHGVLTDHGISTGAAEVRDVTVLLGIGDDRALGLAYAELGDARAREYLLRAKPADADVRLRLATLEPDPSRAAALYRSVLQEKPAQTVALVNLGGIYARAGRYEEAATLWERALEANPAIEEAALNLAQIRPVDQARAILRRYLDFNPDSGAARRRLEQNR